LAWYYLVLLLYSDLIFVVEHGFSSKRSCETHLIEFIDETSNNMASGKQTDVLIMEGLTLILVVHLSQRWCNLMLRRLQLPSVIYRVGNFLSSC
jgi:hypothetical protein